MIRLFHWISQVFALLSLAISFSPMYATNFHHISSPASRGIELLQWQYQRLGDSVWLDCHVPSYVQDELITRGTLPNPHYRDQEKLVQWVDKEDWIYRATFSIDSVVFDVKKSYQLEFDGVDTYSNIYINGAYVGRTESMFVGYSFDVTPYLQVGDNVLTIHLLSPLRSVHAQYLSNGFNYPADNDHASIRYSPFTRKAPYHYGWDWGMRLVGMGIWRDVRLRVYEGSKIESVAVNSQIEWGKSDNPTEALIHIMPEIQHFLSAETDYILTAEITDKTGKVCDIQSTKIGNPLSLKIVRPRLWYPNGWGEAYLYTLRVSLKNRVGKEIDEWNKKIGIREINFVNEPDQWGTSFYWVVNRKPIFIKGANYIPGELLLTRRDNTSFTRLMDDVVFANMNMIRVWGGGVYEDERFYEEADRRGILVWQDFMFACTVYPSDSAFLRLVREEAIYQIKRLRHHACIALWCGNNEVEEAIKYWGWDKKYSSEVYAKMKASYNPLFRELLHSVVKQYAPQQSYIHGSPMRANWGRPESFGHGDSHYWGLWYGKQPFEVFREKKGMRFVSEFGFQSLPSWQTIEGFTLPEDRSLESDVMKSHQKASTGNGLILDYMKRYYKVPSDFKSLVYMSQVLQARGMQEVMQTLRSQRPVCMGALYWQLNDAWPALSWSSIDYDHNYKPLHYTAKRAFNPVALLVEEQDADTLNVYVSNDLLQRLKGYTLQIARYTMTEQTNQRQSLELAEIEPNGLYRVMQLSRKEWGVEQGVSNAMLALTLTKGDNVYTQEYYPCVTKDLQLAPDAYDTRVIDQKDGYAMLEIDSRVLLKDVCLSLPWHGVRMDDNCFDIHPNEKRIIKIYHPNIQAKGKIEIEIMTMNRFYH